MKSVLSVKKQKTLLPEVLHDPAGDSSDAATEIETAELQDDDEINLDDGLDDDNENPVSQSLIGAAENRGEQARDDSLELEGEAEQDAER